MKQILIGEYLKKTYGRKIYKLCVDGGFSCPNRKSRNEGGCLFCGSVGTGEFTGDFNLSIEEQVNQQKKLLSKKWPKILKIKNEKSFIIHFQNYSATYGKIEDLEKLYDEASSVENFLGLVISTRPDLINEDIINLLKKYEIMWVELGLQSANNITLSQMNVNYKLEDFKISVKLLKEANIKVVAHVIYGFLGENLDDFIKTINVIKELDIFGIKIHMLNILCDAPISKLKSKEEWNKIMPSMEEYINALKIALEILPKDIIIHRLTGDGDHKKIIAPTWVKNKRKVLNEINKRV